MHRVCASILLFITMLVLTSCDNGKKANILPPELGYKVDSMYSRNRTLTIKMMDSVCTTYQDDLIKTLTDSLVKEGNEKIRSIIQ